MKGITAVTHRKKKSESIKIRLSGILGRDEQKQAKS